MLISDYPYFSQCCTITKLVSSGNTTKSFSIKDTTYLDLTYKNILHIYSLSHVLTGHILLENSLSVTEKVASLFCFPNTVLSLLSFEESFSGKKNLHHKPT